MSQQVMGFVERPKTSWDYQLAWIAWVDEELDFFEALCDLPPALARMRGFWKLDEVPDEDGYYS